MYTSIEQIKAANARRGHHFFEKSTLRFFSSRIGDKIYHGKYFITSERGPHSPRKWSIRKANEDGSVDTVGEFQAYSSWSAADRAAKRLTGEE